MSSGLAAFFNIILNPELSLFPPRSFSFDPYPTGAAVHILIPKAERYELQLENNIYIFEPVGKCLPVGPRLVRPILLSCAYTVFSC